MKTIRVTMTERVSYSLTIEVENDATDEDIATAAEEQFVQGDYEFVAATDRKLASWEEVKMDEREVAARKAAMEDPETTGEWDPCDYAEGGDGKVYP